MSLAAKAKDVLRHGYYRLPDGFRRAVLVRRRSPLWLRAGIIFIHVPKAAGTSINQALYGQFMGHVRASDVERWGSDRVNLLPSMAVTRNPWDRLFSAYRFTKLAGVWRSRQYRIPEFDSFERFVVEWLSERDVTRLDYHFQPQFLYVCDKAGSVLVDHVGNVENLASTYQFLTNHGHEIAELPELNRSGTKVDYRTFYTPEMVDIVGRIYLRDVQTFSYSFES